MRRYSIGEDFSIADKQALTLCTNQLAAAVAAIADVMLKTPHVASQSQSHAIRNVQATLFNKASKANKLQALVGIV